LTKYKGSCPVACRRGSITYAERRTELAPRGSAGWPGSSVRSRARHGRQRNDSANRWRPSATS
jgi:hypothetical protein